MCGNGASYTNMQVRDLAISSINIYRGTYLEIRLNPSNLCTDKVEAEALVLAGEALIVSFSRDQRDI
jgi:hypothetical protein